jgi:hypothetical protein
MRLNPTSIRNHHTTLDLNERPDKTIATNRAAIEIDGLNDHDASTKINIDDT